MSPSALGVTFLRVPLILAALAIAYAIFQARGYPDALALTSTMSTVAVTATNVVNLILLRRLVHRDGRRLRDLIGFDRSRLGRDIAWGFCWLFVLYLGFVVGLFAVVLAIFRPASGPEFSAAFEETFVGINADLRSTGALPVVLMTAVALVFPFLNAPVEELHYRGWAQPRVGIAVAAIAFGLQHLAFATSVAGMAAFFVAFTLWGAGAGIVYRRQGRLLPLIIAHFLTNLPFGALPLIFVLTS